MAVLAAAWTALSGGSSRACAAITRAGVSHRGGSAAAAAVTAAAWRRRATSVAFVPISPEEARRRRRRRERWGLRPAKHNTNPQVIDNGVVIAGTAGRCFSLSVDKSDDVRKSSLAGSIDAVATSHDVNVCNGSNYSEQPLSDWRSDPSITDVYNLPTLSVPAHRVHELMGGVLKPFVATHMDELDGVHPRLKVVRDFPSRKDLQEEGGKDADDTKRKLILLDTKLGLKESHDGLSPTATDSASDVTNGENSEFQLTDEQQGYYVDLHDLYPAIPSNILRTLASLNVHPGPTYAVAVPYTQQTPTRILRKLLPPNAQPPPIGYEQVGHVLHLNLKPHHEPYGNLIGDVILERFKPNVRTVVTKVGEVKGPYRTYEMAVLAGERNTDVSLTEHGVTLKFDLSKVYWSTRLSGERSRILREELKPGQIIADAFCGVGALCVRAAVELNCTVLGNDLNPDAVRYCRENARRNGASDGVRVECGDARDFIAGLGMRVAEAEHDANGDDQKHRVPAPLPHHLLMNFPLAATDFLGALRWWPNHGPTDAVPTVHVYTFARGDEEGSVSNPALGCRDATEVAVDLVAEGLLQEDDDADTGNGRSEKRGGWVILDSLGCQVRAREVRDVAPGKVVICVSFLATQELLGRMKAMGTKI